MPRQRFRLLLLLLAILAAPLFNFIVCIGEPGRAFIHTGDFFDDDDDFEDFVDDFEDALDDLF